MGALARIVTGRRSKWLVVLVWLVLILPFGALGGKLADATDNRTESFLPAEAESTEALLLQEQRFPGGESVSGLIVYRRAGGLTDTDRAEIESDAGRAAEAIPLQGPAVIPFAATSPPELVSPDGDLAYTIVAVPDDNDRLAEWGTDLRGAVHEDSPDGLEVYVTGGLGFNADFEEVFGDLDAKVLLVTVSLVVVLLLLIYRSPVIALIPLVVVGIAYTIARGLVYLYAESGATVSENGTPSSCARSCARCTRPVSRRTSNARYIDRNRPVTQGLPGTQPWEAECGRLEPGWGAWHLLQGWRRRSRSARVRRRRREPRFRVRSSTSCRTRRRRSAGRCARSRSRR
jgi:MMPL family